MRAGGEGGVKGKPLDCWPSPLLLGQWSNKLHNGVW